MLAHNRWISCSDISRVTPRLSSVLLVLTNSTHLSIHLSSQGQNGEIRWFWCVCLFFFPLSFSFLYWKGQVIEWDPSREYLGIYQVAFGSGWTFFYQWKHSGSDDNSTCHQFLRDLFSHQSIKDQFSESPIRISVQAPSPHPAAPCLCSPCPLTSTYCAWPGAPLSLGITFIT